MKATTAYRFSSISMVAALAVAASGCGPAEEASGARVRLVAEQAAFTYGDAPFPSDAARRADGHLEAPRHLDRIIPRNADSFGRHLEALDGFGLRPAIELFIDGAIDGASIPSSTAELDDAVVVVKLEGGAPGPVVPYDWRWDEGRHVLTGSPVPGVVLDEASLYAAVVTRDVRSVDGLPLAPPQVYRDWSAAPDRVPERWKSTASALDSLARLPVFRGGERIAGVTIFTTQRATRTLVATRGLLADLPPPVLSFVDSSLVFDDPADLLAVLGEPERDGDGQERWGWSNPTGIAHDHVAVLATGTMTLPRFRRADTGTDDPDDETFAVDAATGVTAVAQEVVVPVSLALPKGAPPPDGFPIAIFGHGLGASRHAMLTFIEPLTRAGFAVIAIDMDGHGSRFVSEDDENNLAEILPAFSGDPTRVDGFGDLTGPITTLDLVEGFANLSAFRDSIRQSVLDLAGVARMLKGAHYDLSPLAGPYGLTPTLDTRRLVYLGESYGSVVGAVFSAVEPEVELFVLDVPGGGFLDLILCEGPGMRAQVLPFIDLVYGVDGDIDRFHPVMSMAQAVLDGADPLSYAKHVLADRFDVAGSTLGPRHVVAIEVIDDEVIPNVATGALTRAMGLEILTPGFYDLAGVAGVPSPAEGNVSGQTAVTVQYAPATHGANWTSEHGMRHYGPPLPNGGQRDALPEPFAIDNPIYETLEQVVEVLLTHQESGTPRVRSTQAPLADFDGDGVLDEDEIASGADPLHPSK